MRKEKLFIWLPRVIGIAFTLFLAIFSFDVFDNSGPWYQLAGAFIMHSLPSIVLAIIVWLSWKRPKIANGLNNGFQWYIIAWSAQIAGPAFIVSWLFWKSSKFNAVKPK